MREKKKTLCIQYFAVLREWRGRGEETLTTQARTAGDLYEELKEKFGFKMPKELLRVSINEEFCIWGAPLKEGDRIVFIPPVAGG